MSDTLLSSPQDYFLLAGRKSPGLCEIVGASADYEYLVKQPPASSGTRVVYKRRKPSEFQIRVRCYTDQHLKDFEAFRPLLKAPDARAVVRDPDTGAKGARALDIYHPILADLEIKSVVVLGVSAFELVDKTGVWQVTIKFLQYIGLPKITQAEMEGAQATPADPQDAAFAAESLQNRKKIDALAQELAK